MRLNFLSQLLPEAFAHLHQHLCGSVLGRKLLLLPFNRDVDLDVGGARAMRAAVEHCKRVGPPGTQCSSAGQLQVAGAMHIQLCQPLRQPLLD